MRARAWEQLGLDGRRTLLFVSLMSALFFSLVVVAGDLAQLGGVGYFLGFLTAAAVAYLVSSAPRRMVSKTAFLQTLEAPAFAAAASIYLRSTGSRSKTFLMLNADEERLRSFLKDVRRKVLLGYDSARVVDDGSMEKMVFSESVMTVMRSVVSVDRGKLEGGSDELDGILNSTSLEEETKLPMFMAVSFFLPIMLMLFAAMTKNTGSVAVVSLAVVEIVILDVVLSISGSSVAWEKRGQGGN